MDEKKLAGYRSIFHPLFSVTAPFLFFWVLYLIAGRVVQGLGGIPGMLPVLLLLAGTAEAIVSNHLHSERVSGILPRIWELIIILILSLLLILLATGDLLRGNWDIKRPQIIFPLALIIFMWLSSWFIHRKLRNRELFLSALIGVEPKDLIKTFREYHFEAGESKSAISSVLTLVLCYQAMVPVLLFIMDATGARLSVGTTVLLVIHFIFGIVLYITLNGYLRFQDLSGKGYVVTDRITGRRNGFALTIVLIGGLLAIPMVKDEAPLPATLLADAVLWLEEKLSLPEVTERDWKPEYQFRNTGNEDTEEYTVSIGEGGEERTNHLKDFFRTAVLLLLVGLPAAAIAAALILPLFGKREGGYNPFKRIGQWFSLFSQSILSAVRNARSSFKEFQERVQRRKEIQVELSRESKASEKVKRSGRPGFIRRLTLARNIKAFVQLIRWGEKRGVTFADHIGPREYTASLGNAVPGIREELIRVAELFEEQLFSHHEIDEKRISEYYSTIKFVLGYR